MTIKKVYSTTIKLLSLLLLIISGMMQPVVAKNGVEEEKIEAESEGEQEASRPPKIQRQPTLHPSARRPPLKRQGTLHPESRPLAPLIDRPQLQRTKVIRLAPGWEQEREGYTLLHALLERKHGQPVPAATADNLGLIIWFLRAKAEKKGQGFERGSFVVEDPNGHLWAWIQQIPGLYNRGIGVGSKRTRGSSHLREYHPTSYGVDTNNVPWAEMHTLLLIPFTHAATGTPYLFLKPETAGTATVGARAEHMVQYAKSRHRGHEAIRQRREDTPRDLVNAFSNVIERAKIMCNLHSSCTRENADARIAALDQALKEGKKWGMWKMRTIIGNFSPQENEDAKHEINAFNTVCNQYDHMALRRGEEVIFTSDELTSF